MNAVFIVTLGLGLCSAAFRCSAGDDYDEASELEKAGNSWKHGEPIPAKLLQYRTSHEEGSCFPNPRGTEMLFQSITNFSLLWEVAFLPTSDRRVFSNAVNNAVLVVGPNRFFTDLETTLRQKPELQKQNRIQSLVKQSKVKHIVIDSLYITFADMVPAEIKKVLDEIKRELQGGKPWHDVYWKFMESYEYPYEEKLTNGTVVKGKRTKICNLGDFLLPANCNPLFSYRKDWMPKAHLKKLFAANVGDVLILFDKEDLSRFPDLIGKETGERYVLYRVREVHRGN